MAAPVVSAGRTRSSADPERRTPGAVAPRPPAPPRRAPLGPATSRRTVPAVTSGMSTASTTNGTGLPRVRASRPAYVAATGPPYAGSSRTQVTSREVGRSSPTTTTSAASATAARARSSRVRPSTSRAGLVGSVEALGAAAGEHDRVEDHAPVWQRGTLGVMQVTFVQEASTLDADENRERLAELTPEGSDLVVFPEAFARDFGDPGSDLSGAAEAVDGPFATEVERVAKERGTTVLAGMFERADDPRRPVNTLVLRGAAARRLPQDPPLRLLRLPRVRQHHRRAADTPWSSSPGSGSG